MSSVLSTSDIASLNDTALVAFLGAGGLVLALFALVAHPRFLARVIAGGQAGELWDGWTLRRGKGSKVRPYGMEAVDELAEQAYSSDEKKGLPMSHGRSSSTSYNPTPHLLNHSSSFSTFRSTSTASSSSSHLKPLTASRSPHLPPYFPSLLPTAFTLPLPQWFANLGVHITMGQAFLLLAYGTFCGLATFWLSTPGVDQTRSGIIATAQIPLVVALGSKNTIISAMLGRGSEKYNFLHRFIGRAIFIASTLHGAPFVHRYVKANSLVSNMGKPVISTGTIAYLALILIAASSIPVIRRKAFQFFQICHWLGIIALLVSLSMHVPVCLPFTISSAGVIVLDFLSRLAFKTHNPTQVAMLVPLSDRVTTLVEIPSYTTGWRAGQHVYLRIFHPGMGLLRMCESHPFTIASGGAVDEGEPLRLFAKTIPGGWTERLHGFACSADEEIKGGGRRCKVMIDGPYGGTGNTMFASFSSVLLVSGGSGITFSLAQALALQSKARQGLVRARSIDLVWIVQSEISLQAFLPYLLPLLTPPPSSHPTSHKPFHLPSSLPHSPYKALKINVHVYITRPSAEYAYEPERFFPKHRHPRLSVRTGRPSLSEVLDLKVTEAQSEARRMGQGSNACGLGVGVCGPTGLVRSVKNVVGGIKSTRMSEIGGIEVFAETFGV